jgi:hypothetical protein
VEGGGPDLGDKGGRGWREAGIGPKPAGVWDVWAAAWPRHAGDMGGGGGSGRVGPPKRERGTRAGLRERGGLEKKKEMGPAQLNSVDTDLIKIFNRLEIEMIRKTTSRT